MLMHTTWRRLRHLESLIVRTARRDLRKRRVRAQDSQLALPGAGGRELLDAPLPHRSRELPVTAVPLRSPREHAEELLEQARAVLAAHGIPAVAFPVPTTAGATLALREEDWSRAAALLPRELEHVLLGTGTRQPGTSDYSPRPASEVIERSATLHLLSPAVTRHEGRTIKRYGFETAVRLDRWDREEGGLYTATSWNPRTTLLAPEAFTLEAAHDPDAGSVGGGTAEDPSAPVTQVPLLAVDFPIDVVYTWVDGTDPEWLARKRTAAEADTGERMTADAAADLRFVAHDELRHSLRALELHAPWVRHVHLVTDRQCPSWLQAEHPRLTVVDHTDIAPEGTLLPSFNSQAIEASLHRIDGLSEHFLYFNDDVFLSSPVAPDLFFQPSGIASMYLSTAHVAPGAPVQGEPASDSAGKNARALVHETIGRRVSRKLFHTPFPLRRSVSEEIEQRWPDIVDATRNAQFRRIDDVTLSGALHMNYAYASGRAVTRGIRYRYVDVGAADSAARLDSLMKDRDVLQTFCLNEASQEIPSLLIDEQVRGFLRRRFPDASSFEIPGAL